MREVTPDTGVAGIGGASINDTKPDGGDERSLSENMATAGGVVSGSSVFEEPHHAPVRVSPSDNSLSNR